MPRARRPGPSPIASSATLGASAASFSPRTRHSPGGASAAMPHHAMPASADEARGAAWARSQRAMVSESGRMGRLPESAEAAPTASGRPNSRGGDADAGGGGARFLRILGGGGGTPDDHDQVGGFGAQGGDGSQTPRPQPL